MNKLALIIIILVFAAFAIFLPGNKVYASATDTYPEGCVNSYLTTNGYIDPTGPICTPMDNVGGVTGKIVNGQVICPPGGCSLGSGHGSYAAWFWKNPGVDSYISPALPNYLSTGSSPITVNFSGNILNVSGCWNMPAGLLLSNYIDQDQDNVDINGQRTNQIGVDMGGDNAPTSGTGDRSLTASYTVTPRSSLTNGLHYLYIKTLIQGGVVSWDNGDGTDSGNAGGYPASTIGRAVIQFRVGPPPNLSLTISNAQTPAKNFTSNATGNQSGANGGQGWYNPMTISLNPSGDYSSYVAFYNKSGGQGSSLSDIQSRTHTDPKNGFLLRYDAGGNYYVWNPLATSSNNQAVDCNPNGCFINITGSSLGKPICSTSSSATSPQTSSSCPQSTPYLLYTAYPGSAANRWQVRIDKNFGSKNVYTAAQLTGGTFNADVPVTASPAVVSEIPQSNTTLAFIDQFISKLTNLFNFGKSTTINASN